MLVTRKPRKGKKPKILWSEETLRTQLWWLKPRKVKREVKVEVKQDPGVKVEPGLAPISSSLSPPTHTSQPQSPPLFPIKIKLEPGLAEEDQDGDDC
jgi:hypothetical protein